MSTLEFVSTSADGIAESHAPLVTAPDLVASLGTQPSLTAPLVSDRNPDAALIWARLDEAARFFGTDIPPVNALHDTLQDFLGETAVRHGRVTLVARVMVVQVGTRNQFVVSGAVIEPIRSEPVVLTVTTGPAPQPAPHWRRMAARTAGHAETDLAERDLHIAGYADAVTMDGALIGRPLLGALLVDSVGIGADRLELLDAAGLLSGVTYRDTAVSLDGVQRVRWVSPRFEVHPVRAIGAHRFEEEPA